MTDKVEQRKTELVDAAESLGISQEEYEKIVDECIFGKEEPISEDLGKEVDEYFWNVICNNKDIVLHPDYLLMIARHFSEWQKQQIMKNAVEVRIKTSMVGRVIGLWDVYGSYSKEYKELKDGDVLKVIIIKED